MIPIRVPVDAPTYEVGGERILTVQHPAFSDICPVCDRMFLAEPITIVYVGMSQENRDEGKKWSNGCGVLIHVACGAPGARRST